MALVPKPKRPLSAFNLFYRYKRQKVIALNDANNNKETITNLVDASPGMEDYVYGTTTTTLLKGMSLEEVNKLRRLKIRKEMEGNLKPRDSRTRLHRTNQSAMNGSISFVELGKMMNASWKGCDEFAKGVFKELAEDGREEYRQRLVAWNALSSSQRLDPNETKTTAKKKKSSKKKRAAVDGTSASLPTGSRIVRHSFDSIEEAFQPTGHCNNTFTSKKEVSPPSESEQDLQQQATSLQDNLTAVRLKLRVMELEASLARQKEIESQLRDQINQQQQSMQPLPYYPGIQETGILSVMSAANDLALEEQPHPSPNKKQRFSYPSP